MGLKFFENSLSSGIRQMPNDRYRGNQQALLISQWENGTPVYTVQEQEGFETNAFHPVEVWITSTVGMTSTGLKNGEDFLQFLFQDINHIIPRGLYYVFNDNYWITHFSNQFDGVSQSIGVRRCNNFLRIVDPESGAIFNIPCAVDYDMSTPLVQVSSSVITPNNHAVVMVQGNPDSLRLLKTNTRFMLGGRPFKLYGYQNTLMDDLSTPSATLLYLDLFLDELHSQDDLVNQLAYNGTYDYKIEINAKDMNLSYGATGTLDATITLNGKEVNRIVEWKSSDDTVVQIVDGAFTVVGSTGDSATITVCLKDNPDVFATVKITVVDSAMLTPTIYIDPAFSVIKQFEEVDFNVVAEYGGALFTHFDKVTVSLAQNEQVNQNNFLTLTQSNEQCKLLATNFTQTPQTVYVKVENSNPSFIGENQFEINVVNMFG